MSASEEEKTGSAGGVSEGMKDSCVMYDLLLDVLLRLENQNVAMADVVEVLHFLGDYVGKKRKVGRNE